MVRPGTTAHLIDYHPATTIDRTWTALAVHRLEADPRRSADTRLIRLALSGSLDLYLKDDSTDRTGSLKHRLARSLFLYALCNGWIGPTTTVVEASSGSTAVSEAYFARLIGVSFVAVMSRASGQPSSRPTRVSWRSVPRRVSRASAGRKSSRRSYRPWSTACWESPTVPR